MYRAVYTVRNRRVLGPAIGRYFETETLGQSSLLGVSLLTSFLMARNGVGFRSSGSDHLTWAELARKTLAQGNAFTSPKDPFMRAMISEKFDDPMLGIYAAHCLMMSREPDRDLLNIMIRNLDNLIGGHPDVECMKFSLGMDTGNVRYEWPPMLRSSWSAVLDANLERPDIVPEGSLAAHASSRTWGEGAWFIWQEEPAARQAEPRTLTHAEDAVFQYCLSRLQGEFFEAKIKDPVSYKHLFESANEDNEFVARSRGDLSNIVGAKFYRLDPQFTLDMSHFSEKQVAQTLRLPRSAVQVALNGLRNKLRR